MRSFIIFSLILILFLFAAVCFAQTAPSIVWQKCLGGSSTDYALSIQQTSDGGFIVAGVSTSNDDDVSGWHEAYDYWGNPYSDYWVVKLSPEKK